MIRQFLTNEEIIKIDLCIAKGDTLSSISRNYKHLNRSQNAVFHDYLKKRKYSQSRELLGSKTTPYYEDEEEQMNLMPEYTWESLSRKEKEFYNNKTKENE